MNFRYPGQTTILALGFDVKWNIRGVNPLPLIIQKKILLVPLLYNNLDCLEGEKRSADEAILRDKMKKRCWSGCLI